MSGTMRAVVIHEHGDVDKLSVQEVSIPEIYPHEVLVEVKSVALNHLDLFVRQGWPGLKLDFPHILGSDVAGVVAETGSLVTHVKEGDAVLLAPGWGCGVCDACLARQDNYCARYTMLGESVPGGYAEYIKAPGANALHIPEGLTFEQAAAIPLVFLTAWHMLVDQARVQPGEDVLVLAGGSGVGSAAVQIAKLFGARVFATASTEAKLAKARELGADLTINYVENDFLDEIKKLTQKRGVDVVVEHVGKATWEKSIKALVKGGRLVTCGATSGYDAVTDLRYVFFRGIKILGNFMGPLAGLKRALQFFPEKLQPVVDRTFPLEQAADAHRRLANREQFGKVVLLP